MARQIAEEGLRIAHGENNDFGAIQKILQQERTEWDRKEVSSVPEELETVLSEAEHNAKWYFNIVPLRDRANGLGPASFTVIAARPEAGKTALWISLCAAPDGFAWQGAKIVAFCNEEKATRNRLRIYNSATGLNLQEIIEDRYRAKQLYEKIYGQILLYDCVGMGYDDIRRILEKEKPDVTVVDQLDKVKIDQEFARGDERLREIYTTAREIGKEFETAFIGISQLSAIAQGRSEVDFSMLENSKTGKAAEADLILCLGYNPMVDPIRTINIPKNKLTGDHNPVSVQLQAKLSRFVE